MLNVGLTGGIASGKSTVARMLEAKGAVLIDIDELAHAVMEPDGYVWQAVVNHFGEAILFPDRRIDRGKLGEIVFNDPEERSVLNRLVHPAVFDEWLKRLAEIEQARPDAIVVSDVPLLIEAGAKAMVDMVLLVYIPREEQLRRLIARDGFSREKAERRIGSQMPIDEKIPLADIVIRNEGSIEETSRTVDQVWGELLVREEMQRLPDVPA